MVVCSLLLLPRQCGRSSYLIFIIIIWRMGDTEGSSWRNSCIGKGEGVKWEACRIEIVGIKGEGERDSAKTFRF